MKKFILGIMLAGAALVACKPADPPDGGGNETNYSARVKR